MPKVIDIHNHAIPAGFIERVRAEGAKYGYTLARPKKDDRQAPPDSFDIADVEELTTPQGSVIDLRPRRSDEAFRQKELLSAAGQPRDTVSRRQGYDVRSQRLPPRT